jgi:GTPase SAR1 family protein
MKIGFCGTMSVGKTTLVKALQEKGIFPGYEFVTERSKYLSELGIPLNTDSTLKGQTIFLAERCAELICENIVTDRTVLDVMAFTLLAKDIRYSSKEKFVDFAKYFLGDYDYIFYISPEGIEIEDNGVRTTDSSYREEVDFSIKFLSNQYRGLMNNFHTISGTTDERISQIVNIMGL